MAEEVAQVEAAGADFIHVDVMDGHIVPNLPVGPPIVEALRKVTLLPLDVHLMITNPDAFIPVFAEAGASYLTVHAETCPDLHQTIESIKNHGVKAGVTLKPSTSVPLILRKSLSTTASLAVKTFPSEIPLVKAFTKARLGFLFRTKLTKGSKYSFQR